jgi:hypothetical protein
MRVAAKPTTRSGRLGASLLLPASTIYCTSPSRLATWTDLAHRRALASHLTSELWVMGPRRAHTVPETPFPIGPDAYCIFAVPPRD